nr:glycosyltransferase family 2 protein [uncultured Dyadobacter sp.]
MVSQVRISIALCTYNGEQFLRHQLDSIVNQSCVDWEIVVVDDGSSDGSWDILQGYAAGDSRFRLFRNELNLGYNRNFEKALQLCQAEFIAICDQDDIWHPRKLELQMDAIGDNQMIYHDSEFIDQKGNPIGFRMSDKFNLYRGRDAAAFLYLNCVSGHCILMKKDVLLSALPFPDGCYYDQWLAFIATDRGSVDYLHQPLVQYRQHNRNSTDILAREKVQKSKRQKVALMEKESQWLAICAQKATGNSKTLITRLTALSKRRNRSFVGFGYGAMIWHNRDILLTLLKKTPVSKLFYIIRKIWGGKVKKLL